MRDLGNSITSAMFATLGRQPAGNKLTTETVRPEDVSGADFPGTNRRRPASRSANQTSGNLDPIPKAKEKVRMRPEVENSCLVTLGVPELTPALHIGAAEAGLGWGGGLGCFQPFKSSGLHFTPEAGCRDPVRVRRGTAARASGNNRSSNVSLLQKASGT